MTTGSWSSTCLGSKIIPCVLMVFIIRWLVSHNVMKLSSSLCYTEGFAFTWRMLRTTVSTMNFRNLVVPLYYNIWSLLMLMSKHVIVTCVPVVVAWGPGERRAEGEHQVEQSPCQDGDVDHTAVEEDQLSAIANTCTAKHATFCCRQTFWRHCPLLSAHQ